MSEESKKTELTEDALDNVAGGSFAQNQDILAVMGDIDPEGTKNLLKTWDQKSPNRELTLANKLSGLLRNNLSGSGIGFALSTGNGGNMYSIGEKELTHDQFISLLKNMGKENDF